MPAQVLYSPTRNQAVIQGFTEDRQPVIRALLVAHLPGVRLAEVPDQSPDWRPVFEGEYRGEHEAPDHESGSPLHNVVGAYPEDFYSHNAVQYYGDGRHDDGHSVGIIHGLRNRPNRSVKIYRAVPHTPSRTEQIATLEAHKRHIHKHGTIPAGVTGFSNRSAYYDHADSEIERLKKFPPEEPAKPHKINPGDWVTINRRYAKEHGEGNLGGKYKIISKTVPAKHLFTSGDSVHEQGYDPHDASKSSVTTKAEGRTLLRGMTVQVRESSRTGKLLEQVGTDGLWRIHLADEGVDALVSQDRLVPIGEASQRAAAEPEIGYLPTLDDVQTAYNVYKSAKVNEGDIRRKIKVKFGVELSIDPVGRVLWVEGMAPQMEPVPVEVEESLNEAEKPPVHLDDVHHLAKKVMDAWKSGDHETRDRLAKKLYNKSKHGVHYPGIGTVTTEWDRHSRNFATFHHSPDGTQIDPIDYTGEKLGAALSHARAVHNLHLRSQGQYTGQYEQ